MSTQGSVLPALQACIAASCRQRPPTRRVPMLMECFGWCRYAVEVVAPETDGVKGAAGRSGEETAVASPEEELGEGAASPTTASSIGASTLYLRFYHAVDMAQLSPTGDLLAELQQAFQQVAPTCHLSISPSSLRGAEEDEDRGDAVLLVLPPTMPPAQREEALLFAANLRDRMLLHVFRLVVAAKQTTDAPGTGYCLYRHRRHRSGASPWQQPSSKCFYLYLGAPRRSGGAANSSVALQVVLRVSTRSAEEAVLLRHILRTMSRVAATRNSLHELATPSVDAQEGAEPPSLLATRLSPHCSLTDDDEEDGTPAGALPPPTPAVGAAPLPLPSTPSHRFVWWCTLSFSDAHVADDAALLQTIQQVLQFTRLLRSCVRDERAALRASVEKQLQHCHSILFRSEE